MTSYPPHWDKTRVWVLARPLSGFAETFSHYLIDVAPGEEVNCRNLMREQRARCSSSGESCP